MSERTLIELQGVTKDYGKGKGVFDLSFSVEKGEVFGYLGPNGAGKTTTIRQLMGFIRPEQGKCQIAGWDCFTQAEKIQRITGYLAGELSFPEDMTGMGFLKLMAELKGIRDLKIMRELMERFELDPHGKIGRMSKGMKQKIGIVNAFMHEPKLVILDEPTSGLDPLMQNRFVELILEEKQKGTTVLMSSHMFEEVEKTCDRTAVIRQGRIAAIEDRKTLAGKRKKIYQTVLKDQEAVRRFLAEPGIEALQYHCMDGKVSPAPNQTEWTIAENRSLAEALRILAKYEPQSLETRVQSLEELFFQYYEKGGEEHDLSSTV
ncbi:MAG: ATP-binding cassette domain-containing protein [Lachnospiraceae bacterium]|nr:ATP-binding cassette domain-containing protein [Lachnospiraceae bacterium]